MVIKETKGEAMKRTIPGPMARTNSDNHIAWEHETSGISWVAGEIWTANGPSQVQLDMSKPYSKAPPLRGTCSALTRVWGMAETAHQSPSTYWEWDIHTQIPAERNECGLHLAIWVAVSEVKFLIQVS